MRLCSTALARFGDEGLEARIAMQGFQVVVANDPFRFSESVVDGVAQVLERLVAASGECCHTGEVIPSGSNAAYVASFGRALDHLAEQFL